ncbi:PLP-dependent transferase [Tistrella bauzanensis]|uniref:PLP-dependent transferase n=1 Tax=Tistrella arctica TaxID=3133430 RepID=A0ABU9YST5_9PROT
MTDKTVAASSLVSAAAGTGSETSYARATHAARGTGRVDAATGAVVPPIHVSTTFERAADLSYPRGRVYSRADSAAYDEPEAVLTTLEGGAESMLFASGMAAAATLFQALPQGARIVAPEVMYWGLRKWLIDVARPAGIGVAFVDMTDMAALAGALDGGADLVWIETPSNPLWGVTDIAEAARLAHRAGAVLAVDNTVATPILTRPIEHGADIVMHSATKYLNGHSDVLAGTLTVSAGAAGDPLWQRTRMLRGMNGAVLGPFEAWLLLRGMRTLAIRVDRASANAAAIARHFSGDPRVRAILYPGLPDFPGHDIAARQMTGGFGGMLSLCVAGGRDAAIDMAGRLRLFARATSLGGVESLIEHRASIEGPTSPVPDDLLRVSVGIEDVGDLIADLDRALGR